MWNMSAAVGAEVVWWSRAKGEAQQQRKSADKSVCSTQARDTGILLSYLWET